MAQVVVRLKINQEITLTCDGTNEEECLDNIADYDRMSDYMDIIYENMTVITEDSEFDEEEIEIEDEVLQDSPDEGKSSNTK